MSKSFSIVLMFYLLLCACTVPTTDPSVVSQIVEETISVRLALGSDQPICWCKGQAP